MMDKRTARVLELCRDRKQRIDPKMKWMWGEALFGYALSEWDNLLGTSEFTSFLKTYCDYYLEHWPSINCADHAAPALVTWAVKCKTGDRRYDLLTKWVLEYIREEPRLNGGGVNHLGHSPLSRFYPVSIWVDSLVMFALFPALYGAKTGDRVLLDFAARQLLLYSSLLQDGELKLWYHSYWTKAERTHPRKGLFWGRGNGWALYAFPRIMECIGREDQNFSAIAAVYRDTVEAVMRTQNRDGSFNTLLGENGRRELSATALIATGILCGVRLGYLPAQYSEAGKRAFVAVVDSIGEDSGGLYLPEISGPTIPLPFFPRLGYRLILQGKNWSYGIAAASFAAMEYHQLRNQQLMQGEQP